MMQKGSLPLSGPCHYRLLGSAKQAPQGTGTATILYASSCRHPWGDLLEWSKPSYFFAKTVNLFVRSYPLTFHNSTLCASYLAVVMYWLEGWFFWFLLKKPMMKSLDRPIQNRFITDADSFEVKSRLWAQLAGYVVHPKATSFDLVCSKALLMSTDSFSLIRLNISL